MKTVLECPHCKQTTQTTVPPGKQAKCRKCQSKFRVPLTEATSEGAEFECPECGEWTRSGAAPGQRTTCRSCKAKVRVPLRAAEPEPPEPEADEAESGSGGGKPTVRRTCPGCDEKVPGRKTICPECGVDMDALLKEQRYGSRNGPLPIETEYDLIRNYGPRGGALAMVFALVWFGWGLSQDVIFFYPPLLFVFGLVVFLGGTHKRARSR